MLDLNELGEKLGGLSQAEGLRQLFGQEGLDLSQLPEMLAQTGIDPTDLAGMAPDQITNVLSEHGIDIAQLGEADTQGLIEQLTSGEFANATSASENPVEGGGVDDLIQTAFQRFLNK